MLEKRDFADDFLAFVTDDIPGPAADSDMA